MISRLEIGFLSVATAAHVGFVSLAVVAPESSFGERVRAERGPMEVDVEIIPLSRDQPLARAAFPDRPLPPTPGAVRSVEPRAVGPTLRPELGKPLLAPDEPTDEPSENGADDTWSVPSAADAYGSADAAYGAPAGPLAGPIWSIPGVLDPGALASDAAPAPTTIPKRDFDRDAATKALASAQKARDKSLGLDLPAAGTIASAVKSAVYSSGLPGACQGAIAITLGGDGRVRGAQLVSSAGGTAGEWQQVVSIAKSSLAGQSFQMTGAYAAGAIVTVMARSTMRMPAGDVVTPGPTPGTIGGGMTFDVANIGAKAHRVVTTQFSTAPL